LHHDSDFTGHKPGGMLFDKPLVHAQAKDMDHDPPRAGSDQGSQDENKRPDQPGEEASQPQRDQPDGATAHDA
jgi:hypothetical protein